MRIDAHHHFWKYEPLEYGWIDEEMSAIRRDFLPQDLQKTIAAAGIDGVVSVQARQSLAETRWLLEMADHHEFIRGVVGWLPLQSPDIKRDLERFASNPKLRAVRHVVQGEPDERFLAGEAFNRGVAELKPLRLAYDILIFERQLPQTIEFVDRHPGQIFVLDHIAKPRIKSNVIEPWARNIRELARRDNVFCKISGMVTEADYRNWTSAQLQPYLQTVLDAFSPRKLMFGSDWPVCLVACEYARWVGIVEQFTAALSDSEKRDIFGGTATRAYNLQAGTP